ncbi:MAG: cobalamin biosynthesis protein [Actinomycetota bacterium]
MADAASVLRRRALPVAVGLIGARLLPEAPKLLRPTTGFSAFMSSIEQRFGEDSRLAGTIYAAVGLGTAIFVGRSTPLAVATTAALAGKQVRLLAAEVGFALEDGDVAGARDVLPALTAADIVPVDEAEISATVIETLNDKTTDAVVGPVFWGLVAGPPGALGYRAIQKMDDLARSGRVSGRPRFTWAARTIDDVADFVPQKLTTVLRAAASAPNGRDRQRGDLWAEIRTADRVERLLLVGVAGVAVAGIVWRRR